MVFVPPEIWDTNRVFFAPGRGDGGDGEDGRISGPGPAPSHTCRG